MDAMDLHGNALIPCYLYSEKYEWRNTANKKLIIPDFIKNKRNSDVVFGFYKNEDGEESLFIPFNFGVNHWLSIFQLTFSANPKLDIYYFRYLYAALLTASRYFQGDKFQSALVELLKLHINHKDWIINEIYRYTVLCSLKKQKLVIPILNTFGYSFRTVQPSVIKDAYSFVYSVTHDRKFEDYTNRPIFGHFDCLSRAISQLAKGRINVHIDTDNELLQVLFWINDLVESVPSVNVIDKYFYYFATPIRWMIIRKLFYEHKQGKIVFNKEALEQIINSKRKILYTYRIAWLIKPVPKHIGFEILLECFKNYLEKKKFITFNDILDIVIQQASVLNPQIAIYPTMFMGKCNGGLRLNASFEGFVNMKENEETGMVVITLKEKFYLTHSQDDSYDMRKRIVSFLDQFVQRDSMSDFTWKIPKENVDTIQYIKRYLGACSYQNAKADSHAYAVDWAEINKTIKNREPIGYNHLCYPSLSESPSVVTGKHFLWCEGKPCLRDNLHFPTDWRQYRLPHFLQIWGQDDVTIHHADDVVFGNSDYNKFADILGKAQKITERIICKNCGHLLFPIRKVNSMYANEYAYYCCENEQCMLYKQEIYLNRCYNCRDGVIDSREVHKCTNGMYICPSCFSCCSNDFFGKMINRYVIASQNIPERLKKMVGKGHLEAKIRFCPKCGTEFSAEQEVCPNCKHKKVAKYWNEKYTGI